MDSARLTLLKPSAFLAIDDDTLAIVRPAGRRIEGAIAGRYVKIAVGVDGRPAPTLPDTA